MFAASLLTEPGAAATIAVPPLTIHQLDHTDFPSGGVRDAISIPGSGYTVSLFGATIATGDLVTVRIEAPPGKKFVMRAPGHLLMRFHWLTPAGESASYENAHVVTFENRQGLAPVERYSFITLGDHHQTVHVWKDYDVPSPIEFTAIRFDITATLPLPPVTNEYTFFGSSSTPSIMALGFPPVPGTPILEIVDLATPVRAASWGGVKTRYR